MSCNETGKSRTQGQKTEKEKIFKFVQKFRYDIQFAFTKFVEAIKKSIK